MPSNHEDEENEGGSARARGDAGRVTAELGALVREHPVGALATALGLGYAVGGGLFTRFSSRLVRLAFRVGVKFALLPLLERELAGLAGGLGKPGDDAGAPPAPDRTRH